MSHVKIVDERMNDLLDLINKFVFNQDQYEQSAYKEEQLRTEYIDKYFKILGWDVSNEKGYAEQYKEVVAEDSLKIGKSTKAPDYSFRIGGLRKFIVEVKKPSILIKDNSQAAYQLRSYGWNAKLSLCILTNFKEFAIYDSRIRPKVSDGATVSRLKYYILEDLIGKFDEIYNIFSREAIMKGSFDKYAKKKPKGASEVDQEFLKEIETIRELLAKNIVSNNEQINIDELNYAVQLIINRIVFIRIEEDRGIELYERLLKISNNSDVYNRLMQLFIEADEKYNAGLFDVNSDLITPSLKIDDLALRKIIKNLYYPISPFDFSIIPSDILGQVYEQFLGKIIRITSAKRVKIEYKPEVKKTSGTFYTPSYVAEYIVKNTIGNKISNKSPNYVSKIKILDPACGSGTFLIEAYKYLIDYHLNYYIQKGYKNRRKTKKQKIVETEKGWKLTTQEKKRILLNNIFGVDIDPQAVEVTKLNLLLK